MKNQVSKCIRPIAKGSTKKVYLIDGDILTSSRYTEDTIIEISMLLALHHPNIVKIKDMMKDDNNIIWINQNFKGDMVHQTKVKLTEPELLDILVQMLKTLAYLESNSIIHRDIKAENIVVQYDEEGKIQATLLDFSLATNVLNGTLSCDVYNEDVSKDIYFRPPEINKGKGYDFKADIWALAAAMVEVLAGEKTNKLMKLIYNSTKDRTVSKVLNTLKINDDKLNFILYSMLSYDPKERPSASDCLDYLDIKYTIGEEDKDVYILTLGNDKKIYDWFIDVISDIGLTYIHLYLILIYYRILSEKQYKSEGLARGCIILSTFMIDHENGYADVLAYFDLFRQEGYMLAQRVLEGLDYKLHVKIPSYKDKFYINLFKCLEGKEQHLVTFL